MRSAMAVCEEGKGGGDYGRSLRLPDDGAERDRWAYSSKGYARHPEKSGRSRDLADSAVVGSESSAKAIAK